MYCGKQQYGMNKTRVLDQSMVSCISGYEGNGKNIWMVTVCARGWLSKEILLKCQNVSTNSVFEIESIHQYLPVIDVNNIVYRNEFCAQCNYIKNFDYFSLKITCSIIPPTYLSNFKDMVSFVLKYCGYDHILMMPGQNQARRYCSYEVKDQCLYNDSNECRKGPVAVVRKDYANYKNVWCAQCNGIPTHVLNCGLRISRGVSVFNYGRTAVPSFSIIMDDPKKWRVSAVSQKCPTGKIFDPFLEICRRGKLIPPVKDLTDKYHVVLWLQNLLPIEPYSNINTTEFGAALAKQFYLNITQISHVTVYKILTYHIVEFEITLTSIQSQTVLIQSTKFRKEVLKKTLSIADILHFTRECIIQISSDQFKIFKATSRRLACIGMETYTREEYIQLKYNRYHTIPTNRTFSSHEVFPEGTNITVCDDLVQSSCEGIQVYLKQEEYMIFPNLSIFYNRTRRLYNIGDYRVDNDTLILCINTSLLHERTKGNFGNILKAMEILTIFTFTLSLVSLSALILTYTVFSELRKLPGKNLLNLAVSLFLAQLLWLVAVPQIQWPQFCIIVSIVEHYLFLVTFTAMSVIAFHTKTILASKKLRRPSNLTEDRRRFMIYSEFVWGVPLVFISVTTFFHFFNVYDAGYSSVHERVACWITNRQAQEFLFILPVGLIVLFNTAMFLYTIAMIQVKKRKSQELYASGGKRDEQNMVWIYLKLSSLTGITWIFGFLDVLFDSATFSILFVLFASLQGLYIALSFLNNKRLLKLYRELMMRKQRSK